MYFKTIVFPPCLKRIKQLCLLLFLTGLCSLKPVERVKIIPIAPGWAKNSVNAVVFRKSAIVTHKQVQYVSFYDQEQYVVLARRGRNTEKWTIERTQYKGDATDAHTSISIMVDGDGYLHVSWGHHNTQLNYAKSLKPNSLALGDKMVMTGLKEDNVTYPEFYRLPNGDLLFFYRYGYSGNGDMIINRYNLQLKQWTQVQANLIDGEGERNAYWQACVDNKGTIHVSWVWRESYDVANNHDLCYARSHDGGVTWENIQGEKYNLPININNAAIARHIPQNSELINQTSMTVDRQGNPVIATYWREQDTSIPQYHIVYHDGNSWHTLQVSDRKTPFSLSGGGTKRIPIARPQVLMRQQGNKEQAFLVFRDEERGDKVSVVVSDDFPDGPWKIMDLTQNSVGAWEPSYDAQLWEDKGLLNLFVQKVEQVDQEGLADKGPEMVSVLEWDPPQ